MSKEYIEVDKLYKGIADGAFTTDNIFKDMELMQFIKDFPTADVVEMVRSKDCKYRIKNAFGLGIICDKIGTYMPTENDYYSYGAVQRWIKRRWSDEQTMRRR